MTMMAPPIDPTDENSKPRRPVCSIETIAFVFPAVTDIIKLMYDSLVH